MAEARRLTNEQFEIALAERDDVSIAVAHATLASPAVLEGNYEEAARFLRPAFQFTREIQSRWAGELLALASVIGAYHGRRTEAARLLGAVDAHRDRLGMARWDDDPVHRVIATTSQALDEAGFGWARAEGRGLSFEEALDLACKAAGLTTETGAP